MGVSKQGDCFELEIPDQIDVDVSIYPADCDSLGFISLAITGGVEPYQALLNGLPIAPDFTQDDLDPDSTYILTVTDANDCGIGAVAIIVGDSCTNPPPPPPCIISISSVVVVESSCGNNDGYAVVNVANDPNADYYNYIWSSNIDSSSANQAFELIAGTYSVTIEDPDSTLFDCFIVETFTVGNIDGPESDYEVTHTSCHLNDGTVTFAEQAFEYSWNPDIGTVVSEYERTDLPGGEYYITITDPTNPDCEDVITVVVDEDSPVIVTATVNAKPDCGLNNGSATINVVGGSGDYSYSWGAQTIDTLQEGVYEVFVTDNVTDCTGSVIFSLSVNDPQAEVILGAIDSLFCAGDIFGNVQYTVNYDSGFAFPADTLIIDSYGFEYSNDSLPAGEYCIIIEDANGCQQAGDCFEIVDPQQIDVDVSIYPADCDSLGFVSLAITGGVEPYQALLNGLPIAPDFTQDDLDPDSTYILTVTDANDCGVGAVAIIVGDSCSTSPPPPPPCFHN